MLMEVRYYVYVVGSRERIASARPEANGRGGGEEARWVSKSNGERLEKLLKSGPQDDRMHIVVFVRDNEWTSNSRLLAGDRKNLSDPVATAVCRDTYVVFTARAFLRSRGDV